MQIAQLFAHQALQWHIMQISLGRLIGSALLSGHRVYTQNTSCDLKWVIFSFCLELVYNVLWLVSCFISFRVTTVVHFRAHTPEVTTSSLLNNGVPLVTIMCFINHPFTVFVDFGRFMIDFNTLAYKCVYASIDQQTCTQYTYTFHRPNFSIFNIYGLSVHAVNRRVLSPRQYKFHLLLHTLLWLAAVLAAMPLCLPIACCFHAKADTLVCHHGLLAAVLARCLLLCTRQIRWSTRETSRCASPLLAAFMLGRYAGLLRQSY